MVSPESTTSVHAMCMNVYLRLCFQGIRSKVSRVKQLEGWGGSPLPSKGFGIKPDPSVLSVASLAWPGGCGAALHFALVTQILRERHRHKDREKERQRQKHRFIINNCTHNYES